MYPRDAPVSVRAAVVGVLVIVVLVLLDAVTSLVFAPSGAVVGLDVVLAVVLAYLLTQVAQRRPWARLGLIGVCVLLALTSTSLFRAGVIGLVQAVGAVELVVLVAIVVLLLVPSSGPWFTRLHS